MPPRVSCWPSAPAFASKRFYCYPSPNSDFEFEFLLPGAVERTGRIRLVQGESPQMHALAKQFKQMGFADVGTPKRNEIVSL